MAAGLVGEVAGAFDRFMFCHALVRDAIYDRVSRSRLLRLHLRVGEVIEGSTGGDAAAAGELAHHFFLARELGVAGKAVRYSVHAGERARGRWPTRSRRRTTAARWRRSTLDPDGDERAPLRHPAGAGPRAVAGRRGGRPRDVLRGGRQRTPARRRTAARGRRARARRALLGGRRRRRCRTRSCSARRSTRSATRTAGRARG